METPFDKSNVPECTPPPAQPTSHVDTHQILEHIHRELIEWMTEGTHPYRVPRADHG